MGPADSAFIDNAFMKKVGLLLRKINFLHKKYTERSHAWRWGIFAASPPNYEECAYAKKTMALYEKTEHEDFISDMKELRDLLNRVLPRE